MMPKLLWAVLVAMIVTFGEIFFGIIYLCLVAGGSKSISTMKFIGYFWANFGKFLTIMAILWAFYQIIFHLDRSLSQ